MILNARSNRKAISLKLLLRRYSMKWIYTTPLNFFLFRSYAIYFINFFNSLNSCVSEKK